MRTTSAARSSWVSRSAASSHCGSRPHIPSGAARARLLSALDLGADCARISAPTLVVTGERALDHVVPADGSSQYARLITDARAVMLERTGHLGTITRPDAFAEIVHEFVRADTSVGRGAA